MSVGAGSEEEVLGVVGVTGFQGVGAAISGDIGLQRLPAILYEIG